MRSGRAAIQSRPVSTDIPVCTENSILIDYVTESPNVSGDDRSVMLLPDPGHLAVQVEEPSERSSENEQCNSTHHDWIKGDVGLRRRTCTAEHFRFRRHRCRTHPQTAWLHRMAQTGRAQGRRPCERCLLAFCVPQQNASVHGDPSPARPPRRGYRFKAQLLTRGP